MKKIIKSKIAVTFCMLLLSTAFLCSCSKDSNNPTPTPTPANGGFAWTVNRGTTVITANTGTKVTGTFQGTGTLTSGTNSVAGTCADIPVQ